MITDFILNISPFIMKLHNNNNNNNNKSLFQTSVIQVVQKVHIGA